MKPSSNSYPSTDRSILSRGIVLSVICLSTVFIFSLSTFAGLSVTPLLLDLTMKPGSSHTGTLSLQNTGTKAVHVESQIRGFRTSEKGVALFLSESSADLYPYSGENLLTVTPESVDLGPGERQDFTYEIRFPDIPEPLGGRYVGALFKVTPVENMNGSDGGSNIRVATRVGTLILIRHSEEILVGNEFKEFQVTLKLKISQLKGLMAGRDCSSRPCSQMREISTSGKKSSAG